MASKRAIRRKSCEGKQQHATAQAAQAHVTSLRYGKGEFVQPYRCRFGNHWHVGHGGRA